MYGAPPPQISEQMQPPDPPPHPPRPQPFLGFTPFQQWQGQQQTPRPAAASPSAASRESQPFLSLSLEQPEPFGGMPAFSQQYPQQRLSFPAPRIPQQQPLRPATVRASFDLEQQPLLQHSEQQQPEPSVYLMMSAGGSSSAQVLEPHSRTPEASQMLEHADQTAVPPNIFSPEEQGDGLQLQLVPASQFPPPDQSEEQQYPLPLASHEAVVQDKELFMTTLDNFLAALRTRLTVPKVGEKDMDLHAMYQEVTAQGGLEQVIRNAQWKELAETLGISIPSPSISFVLRKHYTNLLFHYEQVYYFRTEGQLRSPPVPLPAPSPTLLAADIGSPYEAPPEIKSSLKKRKRKLDPMQVFGVDPAAAVGTIVTGAISGKFDEGYLVTVVVGTEKLTGVLYHIPVDNNVQQFASVPSLLDGVGSEWDVPGVEIRLHGKKREFIYKKDPNAPRRTRTGYNIFFKEQRAKLRQLHPEKNKQISKMVIEMWSRLPENEKALYIERGQQEREKYKKEFLEYQERLRLQSQICDGNNGAGQPVAEHDHGAYDVSHDYHVSLDVEGDIMSFQGAQPQVSEMDGLQSGQGYPDGVGYHVNGPLSHIPQVDTSGGPLESEQAYDQEEGEYAEEDEEEGDPDLEEAYPVDEEETGYPGSEQGYDGQDDGSQYPISEDAYNTQDDGVYHTQVSNASLEVHGGSTSEQPYYVQDHAYAYPSSFHQQQGPESEGSGGMASTVQVAYHVRDNGQVFHPHLQSCPETSSIGVPQQQYYGRDRYVYAHLRQGQGVEAEALGVPVPSDQAAYRGQDERLPYPVHLQHQNQAVETNPQNRQVSSEQTYQDRYPYPVHLPYTQAYAQPHTYPLHFPHAHSYPVHLPETQALQYGHPLPSHVHQPQASTPEVSGSAATSSQSGPGYRGHTYHAQEDGQTMPAYKHGS